MVKANMLLPCLLQLLPQGRVGVQTLELVGQILGAGKADFRRELGREDVEPRRVVAE